MRTNYVALQYSLLNSPPLLFVSWGGGGRARLTIGPIGRIVLLAGQVARPPNAPASSHFASALSTVRAPSVSAHPLQGTIPYLEGPPIQGSRVSASSHKPVPPRNIPSEPAARDNPSVRAKTATHKGKPLGIISKGDMSPGHQHQRGQKPRASASAR